MEIVRALLNKYADIDVRGQVGASLPLSGLYLMMFESRQEAFLYSLYKMSLLLNMVYLFTLIHR